MKLFLAIMLVFFLCADSYSESVVDIARSQIGQGEIGGNNRGEIVKKYTRGQEVPWCAGFVSYCLLRSGRKSPYFLAAKSFFNSGYFRNVKNPRPGDLVVWSRGFGGHVGIIEDVQGGEITTIEGNVGEFPAKVSRHKYRLGHIKNLIGFVRL